MLPTYTHDLDNNGAFVSHFTHSFRSNWSAFDQKNKIRIATESLSFSPSFNLDDFISSLISIVAILFSILMIALRFIFFVLYFISSIFYVLSALSVVWSTVYFTELFALLCFVVFFFVNFTQFVSFRRIRSIG